VFQGTPTGFGRAALCLQRRHGKLFVDGMKVGNPAGLALVRALAAEHAIPIDDDKTLQKYLAKEPRAQKVIPFETLQYIAEGRQQAVPLILLAANDRALLLPALNEWHELERQMIRSQQEIQLLQDEAERQRAIEEQQLRNQRASLEMQYQSLVLQNLLQGAAWAQAMAAHEQADAQRRQAEAMEREEKRRRRGY
jgi:carboxylesterase type B